VSEKVGASVREIITRRIGDVMGDFDFLHLPAIDRMGAEIAWDR
jgi:hypothetical protein